MPVQAEANIGNDFRFQVGDGGSPEAFNDLCAVVDFGDLGEEKALIDISTLCSTAREYRNGMADGVEISLKVNFKDGNDEVRDLYADFHNDETRNFRIRVLDSGSPEESFTFAAIIRGWNLNGPLGEKASMTFKLKISGDVTWNQA